MNDTNETEFNPDEFVQSQIDGSMSTQIELIPRDEYRAVISEVGRARKITPNDPSKRPFASVDVTFTLLDTATLAESLGRGELKVRYNLLLDLDDFGKLDVRKGKNTRLGKLRELAGQNGPGPWAFGNLVGTGPYTVKVDYEEDKRDAELPMDERRKYERVVSVAKG